MGIVFSDMPFVPAVTPHQEQAATLIKKVWRGARQRQSMANAIANNPEHPPPYQSGFECAAATNMYSIRAMANDSIDDRRAGAAAYMDTMAIRGDNFAYLHSLRHKKATDSFVKQISPREPMRGQIYKPPNGMHDMRINSMWLLGLAHRGTTVLMTAPLTDETIIRREAVNTSTGATTDENLSAYAREVVGMLKSGSFRIADVVDGSTLNYVGQGLIPTQEAANAKLSDFHTSRGLPKAELKFLLQEHGVDVEKISDDMKPLRLPPRLTISARRQTDSPRASPA